MRNSIKTLTLAAVTAAFTVPAFAGGMTEPVLEPVVIEAAPVYVPSGNWTGGYVGAQLGYGNVKSNIVGTDGSGILGGVHAGYRYDFGQFVAGAELDYDKTNIDLNATDSLDSIARLKLMAGADLGNTLLYVTAGPARAKASLGGVSYSDSGYFGGIGAAYALTDQWTVGGELLSHRFKDIGPTSVDLKPTTLTMRASYRF